MKYKVKDNHLHGEKIRKKRNWYKGKVERLLGNRSTEYRKLMQEVKKSNKILRLKLKKKYEKKVMTLEKKYGKLSLDLGPKGVSNL